MTKDSYAAFNLTILACEDGIAFGLCRHMEVVGWPERKVDIVDIAQDLSQKEHSRYMLLKPLPITPN